MHIYTHIQYSAVVCRTCKDPAPAPTGQQSGPDFPIYNHQKYWYFFNATQIVNFNNKIFLQKINFMQYLFLLTHLLVQAWYSIHSSGQRLSSIQYIVHTQARDRDKTQYRPSYLQINTEQHQLEFIIFSFSGRLFCDLKTIFKVKFWLSFRFKKMNNWIPKKI